jgi:hypothetical protein
MSGGCTDCGKKGGCDSRKHGMFAAVDEAMARLYPTRRWADRDEEAAFGAGVSAGEGRAVARALASRLKALAVYRPGTPEETCDFVYVLCLGRTPSLFELREGLAEPVEDGGEVQELYLRVALSSVARFAGVQQVAMHGARDQRDGDSRLVITEATRAGVFDPVLLKRFQALVAVLAEHDIRHLDFGEIVEPPDGFDPGDYGEHWNGVPGIANYLFFPHPPGAVSSTTLPGVAVAE